MPSLACQSYPFGHSEMTKDTNYLLPLPAWWKLWRLVNWWTHHYRHLKEIIMDLRSWIIPECHWTMHIIILNINICDWTVHIWTDGKKFYRMHVTVSIGKCVFVLVCVNIYSSNCWTLQKLCSWHFLVLFRINYFIQRLRKASNVQFHHGPAQGWGLWSHPQPTFHGTNTTYCAPSARR